MSETDKLTVIFEKLKPDDQKTVIELADFLLAKSGPAEPEPLAEPRLIPRPDNETVIGAMKRLSASYPMLDKAALLNDGSALMTAHILQGRAASEVIDELEKLFADSYAARATST